MFYPEEFKAKVKRICHDDEEAQKLLENGDSFLAIHLSYTYEFTFSFQEVLDAKSLDELKKKANRMKALYELSLECKKICNSQR